MSELTCPHCGKALQLTAEGRLVEAVPAAEERSARRPRAPEPWGQASGSGMDAFAGAFKRKPSAPAPVARAPEPRPAPPAPPPPAPVPLLSTARSEPAPEPRSAPTPTLRLEEPGARPAAKKGGPQRIHSAGGGGPSRPAPDRGLTVLDALARDPSLNQGQRETLRLIYVRFAPAASAGPGTDPLDLGLVLEEDANLNEGQRETLRLIHRRFKRPG